MIRRLLLAFLLLLPFKADAIIFVASATASQAGNSGNLTITLPAHQTNDIIIIAVQTANQAITAPTGGWVEIDSQGSMATGAGGTVGDLRMAIFWKRAASSSETNPVILDTGDHQMGAAVVVRGAVTTGNPWDVETCGVQATTNTAVSWTGMSYGSNGGTLTTTVDGTLVLGFIGHSIKLGVAQLGSEACATLNNVNEEFDVATSVGTVGGGVAVFSGYKPGAGVVVDTGSNNATATMLNTSKYAMFMIALKPANSSGPLYIGRSSSVALTTAVTVALDLIYAANDILLLVVNTGGNAIGSTPAGWVAIDTSSGFTGTDAVAGSLRLTVLWRRAVSSSETAPAIGDSGDHQVGQVFAFRNCIATGNPWDVESIAVNATAGTAADWTSGTMSYGSAGGNITSTVANTVVLGIISNAIDSAVSQTTVQTMTALTNFNPEVSDVNSSAGQGGGFSVSIGDMSTAGAIVTSTTLPSLAATLAASSKYAMQVIALKPPVSGATAQQKAAFFQLFP